MAATATIRRSDLIAIALIGCGSGIHATHAPITRTEAGCRMDGNVVDVGPVAADAPLVVLDQRNPFFASDVPVIAIWADGTIARERFDVDADGDRRTWTRATIAPVDAARIARDVATELHGSTRSGAVSGGATDRPTIGIIVRDGGTWRVSEVHGIERGTRGRGFAAAYRELLAVAPSSTAPYVPVEYGIEYDRFDSANADAPWPTDLPPPPEAATDGGMFIVPAGHDDALQAFRTMMADHQSLAITFNGGRWSIQIRRRYRGQQTIDRVRACARDRDDVD